MTMTIKTWRLATLVVAISLAVVACSDKSAQERQQKAAEARAAYVPTVHVVTVQPQDVLLENNLPGRLEAVRSAPIVPQVTGIVKRRLFQEGSFVKAGQPLYQLDDATYQANLESARASLLSAQAALTKAEADVVRYRPLAEAGAVSKADWDNAVTTQRSAQAQVKAAQAAVRSAQVNVNYARITAPISGFIGQSAVTEGALVTANSTQMALIQQSHPMYVNITQSATDVLALKRQLASQERTLNQNIEVSILLEDGSEYEHKGRLLFIDPTVDESTGQVNLRVEVPNPDDVLMNGLYVRVKLPLAGVSHAFVVPQQAVTRGQQDTVLIVTPEGKMEPRVVNITAQQGSNWIITGGLQAGDKVIVDGTMIAGISGAQKVQAKEWQSGDSTQQVADDVQAASDTDVQAASDAVVASSAE